MTINADVTQPRRNKQSAVVADTFKLECGAFEFRNDCVQFTFQFIRVFVYGLELAAPLLIFLALLIVVLGQIVGLRESWNRFDSLYWSFITATTVGYGDIRPLRKLSKTFSILIALTGMIFTGIIVALAINAASTAFSSVHDGTDPKTAMEKQL